MRLAVTLQIVAVVMWMTGGFLLAGLSGVLMAAAVPAFLGGWALEQHVRGES